MENETNIPNKEQSGRLQQPAVPRRSIVLSRRREQKLWDDVHEAVMQVRIRAQKEGRGSDIDNLLYAAQFAACRAAIASVKERL